MSLDTRAREAAAALTASLDALPAGPPPLRAPSTGRRALLAAAVVLAVVAVAVVALRDDERAAPVVTTPGTDVPRLVPPAVPDGLEPTGAADLPLAREAETGMFMVVFGDPTAADPFAAGDLAMTWWRSGGDLEPGAGDRDVTVRGRRGTARDGDEIEPSWVQWREEDVVVTLSSRHLAVDALLTVADGAVVAGGDVVIPRPPDGLVEVGRADMLLPDAGSVLLPAGAPGHVAGWQAAEGGRLLVVATVAADIGVGHALAWLAGPSEPVVVRGRRGWSSPGGLLVWPERDGVLAMVAGTGLDPAAVREVAESLREASDEEWAALVGMAAGHTEEEPGVVATLPVPPEAGTATVQLHDNGDVCLERVIGEQSAVGCGPQVADGDLVVAVEVPMEDGTTLVYGRAPEGTVAVAVSSETGAVAGTLDVSADRLWAVLLAAGHHADRVDATAADGTQLASVVPHYP